MKLEAVSERKGTDQNTTGDRELLAVSFGTSYSDTRARTIGAIERAMEQAMPEYACIGLLQARLLLTG